MDKFFSIEHFTRDLERVQAYQELYETTHDESVLELEIDLWHRLLQHPFLAQTPPDMQGLLHAQAGQSFFYRYENQERLQDLEMAIRLFSQAYRPASDPPLRSATAHSLGDVFTRRYTHLGKLEDLEQSIAYYRKAVAHGGPGSEDVLASYMDDIGTALRDYFTHTGDVSKLDESIQTHREALQFARAHSCELSLHYNHLGNCLIDRYHHCGQLEDVQQAVESFQKALDTSAPDHSMRSGYLSNLGNALSSRSKHLNTISDLERAIQLQREARRLAPEDAYIRTNLAAELGYWYDHTGKREAIAESIALLQQLVEETPETSPDLPDYHSNLAASFQKRFDRLAHPEDLRQAIEHFQTALALLSMLSDEQATAVAARSAQTGKKPLLRDASARPAYLEGLANAWLSSYGSSGRMADLQRAIAVQREALQLIPSDALSLQAEYRHGLAILLVRLHDHTPERSLLDEAITLLEYGLQHLGTDSPQLASLYNELGATYRQRYLFSFASQDRQRAIDAFHKALALLPPDSPDLSKTYTGLGNTLRAAYEHTHDVQDLDAAIDAYRKAVQTNQEELASNTTIFYSNLSTLLFQRYDVFQRPEDLEEARSGCEQACQSGSGMQLVPEVVRGTARPWGNREGYMGNWSQAEQAYKYAVQAQEQLYRVQLLQSERERLLSEENEIYARAGYVLARVGKLEKAAATLEQGRAKRLGEALARDQADLERLQRLDPRAFEHYQEAVRELRQLEQLERSDRLSALRQEGFQERSVGVSYDEINRAREQLEQAIERIRQLPDFQDFLSEPTFERIAASATPAYPLAYLLVTPWGSLVLLVRHQSQKPEVLFLDKFRHEHLQHVFFMKLPEGLREIGEHLIGPLARRLQATGAQGIILIPVGMLGVLPLHAASYQEGDRAMTLLDQFDVVYAPSVRVLQVAQREAQRRGKGNIYLLAFADPTINDKALPLMGSRAEVEHITHLLPEATTAFYAEDATLEAFWKHVPQATIVHFACHGTFDSINPLHARLLLAHRKKLTLGDLLNAEPRLLARLRMAVLSACQSAQFDPEHLPDEVIGLPAGFLQAGVPQVVGTLWSVNDRSTELLMRRFYELLLRGDAQNGLAPQPPARALRLAQLWLRDLTQEMLETYLAAHSGQPVDPTKRENIGSGQSHPYANPYHWAAFVYLGVPPDNAEARQ